MRAFIVAVVIVCLAGGGSAQITTTQTPTTTAAPPTSKKAQSTRTCVKSVWCYCDLSNLCELGCCCDPDCERTVTDAFENECPCEVPNEYDVPYCSNSDILISNQTHLIKRSIGGLICLVDDHVYKKDSYTEGKPLTADKFAEKLKYLEAVGEFHNLHADYDHSADSAHERGLREGDPLKIKLATGATRNFGIPIAMGGDKCDAIATIQFLKPRSSRCMTQFSCENPFSRMEHFTGVGFVTRNSKFVEPLAEICFPNKDCAVHSTPDLTECSYIHKVEYRIVHNGTLGVQDVYIFVHRKESPPPGGTWVPIQIDVIFETKQDATVRLNGGPIERSGNPGYIFGKPVLAKNGDSSTRPVSAPFKDCTDSEGRIVLFGENVETACLYPSCGELAELLPAMLTGDSSGFIGAYGSSDARMVEDWVPVEENAINFNESCAYRVEVIFAYMRTQFTINPQNRIVYARVRYTPLRHPLPLVEMTVDFVDVSSTPEVKYAGPPIIDIKLPEDFFYPLHLGTSSSTLLHPRQAGGLIGLLLLVSSWARQSISFV
ncbi:tectonic-3 [Galendromus occidentalis]|uniref:Tectonic-3 n=1 Tax=Galendromus occidentalis TaxID=34638 RepID=A0AAJ7L5A2_9ACAR|nr:tectonic-3 [Galendromus occidentalis]